MNPLQFSKGNNYLEEFDMRRIQNCFDHNFIKLYFKRSFHGIGHAIVLVLLYHGIIQAQTRMGYISFEKQQGSFSLCSQGTAAPIIISSKDFSGVLRVAKNLQRDIQRVTSQEPVLCLDSLPSAREVVLIGTLGKNQLIDRLVQEKKFVVDGIAGNWESFLVQIVENPFPNIDRALVVAGSDKRGTIYGMYDISKKIGVSPWYWWADVPVQKHPELYVAAGTHVQEEPKVKYRGIFINDEAPALSGWAYEKFGGFNSKFYEKVYDLILRMRGNYLWPAMWGRSLFADDTVSHALADEYGVVIGTSHHEPMMRAHVEWGKGPGTWNYQKNEDALKLFWRKGIQRMGSKESIVTIGMRGDGDEPMSEDANISLLEKIVRDQRQIIGEVTGKDVTIVPQLWALYKEVQEYYDKGMRVPDDVTLLLCDDNWGNIRKLPKLHEKPRKGGYGIYYHYDYVGGPRNYKWLNTNQISRVWEQMHLAYEYNARQIWIVNVGDIKPMEFPIEFFLDYAWNPDAISASDLPEYTRRWVAGQFGEKYASEIADILTAYTKYNARRKPELLSPTTYSLVNYREAETVVAEYNALAQQTQSIYAALPQEYKDAYYQLVLHPVSACANLNDLYVTIAKNQMYAQQGRAMTNDLADRAKQLFDKDSTISYTYNRVLAGGKWNHMMDQTHIGYTYWQQPDYNSMPAVKRIEVASGSAMGIAVEGSESWWPKDKQEAELPAFDRYNQQSFYFEIFNRGNTPFQYEIRSAKNWIIVNPTKGTIEKQNRIAVSIDWNQAPRGENRIPIHVTGPDKTPIRIYAVINNPSSPSPKDFNGFIESNGFISIEAENYSRAVDSDRIRWLRIPDLGRTKSALTAVPVTDSVPSPLGSTPHLEYRVHFFHSGKVKVNAFFSPTLNFHNTQGLRFAISWDNEIPQIMNLHGRRGNQVWEGWVANNIIIGESEHTIQEPGAHTLKYWLVDPGVVVQKFVVETGKVKPSYLGPPESFRTGKKMEKGEPE
jgi:hypothetical protein